MSATQIKMERETMFKCKQQIKELEAKLAEQFEAGQASAIPKIRELEAKLKVAVEALEDISSRTSSWESNPAAVALAAINGEA